MKLGLNNSILMIALFCGSTVNISNAEAAPRGLVSSQPCPFNCASQGIPKNLCRDWREGEVCFVEDLRRNPGPAPRVDTDGIIGDNEIPGPNTEAAIRAREREQALLSNNQSAADNPRAEECSALNARSFPQPRIEIEEIKDGSSLLNDEIRVRGTIEGSCLSEAGYYEKGRRIEEIKILTIPEFRRFEFNLKGRRGEEGEIRAYNSRGEREVFALGDIEKGNFLDKLIR